MEEKRGNRQPYTVGCMEHAKFSERSHRPSVIKRAISSVQGYLIYVALNAETGNARKSKLTFVTSSSR